MGYRMALMLAPTLPGRKPPPQPVLRVYLAARFSRQDELNRYRAELAKDGIEVTSRWLAGAHEWAGMADDDIPSDELARFAAEDLEDIDRAYAVVCFTEPPRTGPTRGGRHVEMGYALASKTPVLCVGHRENIFCYLPEVDFVETWDEAREWLRVARP